MNTAKTKQVPKEIHQLAQSIIEGKCSLDSVEPSKHKSLLAPLSAFRNQALFLQNEDEMKRIEGIISQLILIPSKKKVTSSKPININLQSNNNCKLKITADERNQMNKIIDSLILDSEIDTINQSFIPKLLSVIKERNSKALSNGDYNTSERLQSQIRKLEKMKGNNVKPPSNSTQTLELYNRIRDTLKQKYEDYENKKIEMIQQRKHDEIELNEKNKQDIVSFEDEKESLENGDGFTPSQNLSKLYQKLKLAKTLQERDYIQRRVEKLENTEMLQYIAYTDNLIKEKKEKLIQSFEEEKHHLHEKWNEKLNNLYKQFIKDKYVDELQFETVKKRMKNSGIQYEPYSPEQPNPYEIQGSKESIEIKDNYSSHIEKQESNEDTTKHNKKEDHSKKPHEFVVLSPTALLTNENECNNNLSDNIKQRQKNQKIKTCSLLDDKVLLVENINEDTEVPFLTDNDCSEQIAPIKNTIIKTNSPNINEIFDI